MEETLIRLVTENTVTILLSVLAGLTSTVLMSIRNMNKSVDKTSQQVDHVNHLVNGSLSARLAHMQNNLQEYMDMRFNNVEQRIRGLEARLTNVEEEHEKETQ
jgi:hypothetical protein